MLDSLGEPIRACDLNEERSPDAASVSVLLFSVLIPGRELDVLVSSVGPPAVLPVAILPVSTFRPALLPSAVTLAPTPMNDLVSLVETSTPAPAATPTAPAASTPTISVMSDASLAAITTLPVAWTLPAP